MQKNSNKSLDFGSKLCYNGSVYPERNENHSHLDGFLGTKHPANLGHRLRFALFWGNVPLSCVCLGWLLGIGNRTPLGHLFVLRYNPMISRPVVDTRDLNPQLSVSRCVFFWGYMPGRCVDSIELPPCYSPCYPELLSNNRVTIQMCRILGGMCQERLRKILPDDFFSGDLSAFFVIGGKLISL